MDARSYRDRHAAWRALGRLGPEPTMFDDAPGLFAAGRAATAAALQRHPDVSKRAWRVPSSDGTTIYVVEERMATVGGKVYLFCPCKGWAYQFGRDKDCRHVARVKQEAAWE